MSEQHKYPDVEVKSGAPEGPMKQEVISKLLSYRNLRFWILAEIESSQVATYPDTGESKNQVFSAYHEDLKTVGYGRKYIDNCVVYNNPFDPRLTFQGLGEYIHYPDVKDEKHKTELIQNVFLALDQPSQFMDKYLNGYRAYVRGLCESPWSEHWCDSDVDGKRLYDRTPPDSVKSIWSDKHDNITKKEAIDDDFSIATAHYQQSSLKTQNIHIQRLIKETCENFKNEVEFTKKENTGRFEGYDATKEPQNDQKQTESVEKTSWPSLGKSDKPENTFTENKNRKQVVDSWAALFKKPNNDHHSNPNTETNCDDEDTTSNQDTSNEIEKCSEQTPNDTLDQNQYSVIQPSMNNYMIPVHTQVSKPHLPTPLRNHGNQGIRFQKYGVEHEQQQQQQQHVWSQQSLRQEPYNNQPQQWWTDHYTDQPNQQYQSWSEHSTNTHQQPSYYQSQHTYIQPSSSFNQTYPHNCQSFSQMSNYQVEQQPEMYYNYGSQQHESYDQQSLMHNLQQRYIQQPTTHIQNPTNRYQYYQSPQKDQVTYQGNWNANNNSDYNIDDIWSSETNNCVHYSKHSLDTSSDELYTVKEPREKLRFKSRQIHTNLIRIYPSNEGKRGRQD